MSESPQTTPKSQHSPERTTHRLTDPLELCEEIDRLRQALRDAERKLDYADRETNPHDLADWARGALEIVRRALGE